MDDLLDGLSNGIGFTAADYVADMGESDKATRDAVSDALWEAAIVEFARRHGLACVGKEASFRAMVVRVAHENPTLRPYLIPLLVRTARDMTRWLEIEIKNAKESMQGVEGFLKAMEGLLPRVQNADRSAAKRFDSMYKGVFELGRDLAKSGIDLMKYADTTGMDSEALADATTLLDYALRQWKLNLGDHVIGDSHLADAKLRQAKNTGGYAIELAKWVETMAEVLLPSRQAHTAGGGMEAMIDQEASTVSDKAEAIGVKLDVMGRSIRLVEKGHPMSTKRFDLLYAFILKDGITVGVSANTLLKFSEEVDPPEGRERDLADARRRLTDSLNDWKENIRQVTQGAELPPRLKLIEAQKAGARVVAVAQRVLGLAQVLTS